MKREEPSTEVPARDKQVEEDLWQRHGAERGVWTEPMLAALEIGLKGNKWFSLIDKVWSEGTLELAWEKVKSNAGACGMDGITIGRFAKDSRSRLLAVKEHLKRGTYQPKPVKRVWIPKPGSTEKRPLGIPTVTDRVVQAALRMVIEPIFESRFAEGSHGFRPGRGCKDALRQVEGLLRAGHLHVVDVDIKGYFDTIPHERLMALVRERLADGRVDPLEWEMAGEGFAMARYADDMVVLCRSLEEAHKALAAIKEWMAEAGLALHPEKTRLLDMTTAGSHFDFVVAGILSDDHRLDLRHGLAEGAVAEVALGDAEEFGAGPAFGEFFEVGDWGDAVVKASGH